MGNGGSIILAQKRRDGGGNLALRHGAAIRSLAQRRCVRPDDGDPDVFGALDLFAMIAPGVRAVAAAVIGGDDERRFVAVGGDGLHGAPETFDEAIHVVRGFEHVIVTSAVRNIVLN